MPWKYPGNIPKVAKNWTPEQQRKCITAGNAVLRGGGTEENAIYACIRAAGKTKHPGGQKKDGHSTPLEGHPMTTQGVMMGATTWVDLFKATKVLDGEPVRIVPLMPEGYHRHGVHQPPITEQDLQIIFNNWEKRSESGLYQSHIPLNKEHEHQEGKVGTFETLELRDDGLYGTFQLTDAGRKALQEDGFDYLSPEIRWETIDIQTGQDIGPSLAGCAVTNYPFFGDRLAMYSTEAEKQLAEAFPAGQQTLLSLISYLTELVQTLGWRLRDLIIIQDESGNNFLNVENVTGARFQLIRAIVDAAKALPDLHSQRALLELYAETKDGGDGCEYPRSAFALTPDGPPTWKGRYKIYRGDRLLPDLGMIQVAAETFRAMNEVEADDGWVALANACIELDTDFETIRGGMQMSNNQDQGVKQEEFAAQLAARDEAISKLTTQVEEFGATLQERDRVIAEQGAELTQMRQARLVDRFTHMAEGFTGIGAETQELAGHLAWLYQVDGSDDRAHYNYFEALLKTANKGLAQGAAFREHGSDGSPPDASVFSQVERKVAALAKERGIPVPSAKSREWADLASDVFKEEPDLYENYRQATI